MIDLFYYHALPEKGDILPSLWQAMKVDNPEPWVWGNAGVPSLANFIVYFSDEGRHLFLPFDPETRDCYGMLWVDELLVGVRARAHMYFFRKFQRKSGSPIVEACHAVLRALSLPPFCLNVVYLYTDNRAVGVQNFAKKRMGATYVASLPQYYPGETASVGYILLEKYRT